jgi:hypothetical protein
MNKANIMRNNFVDPHDHQRVRPEEYDRVSVGSAEQKPLGVVREGFKKASIGDAILIQN